MDLTRKIRWAAWGCMALALFFGYALRPNWLFALLSLLVAAGWGLNLRLPRKDISVGEDPAAMSRTPESLSHPPATLAFLLMVWLALVGVWLLVQPIWLLLAACAALIVWDLSSLIYRADQAGRVNDPIGLEQAHLRKLALTISPGFLLALVAIYIPIRMRFGLDYLIGLLLIIALAGLITLLRSIE